MTRTELRDKMFVSGELERPDKDNPNWQQAFELYKSQTGDYQVSLKCSKCFGTVKKWLTR
jgi:predicted transcriptional regulator